MKLLNTRGLIERVNNISLVFVRSISNSILFHHSTTSLSEALSICNMADSSTGIPDDVLCVVQEKTSDPTAFVDSYHNFLASLDKPCAWIREFIAQDASGLLDSKRQTVVMSVADDYEASSHPYVFSSLWLMFSDVSRYDTGTVSLRSLDIRNSSAQ